MCFLVIRCFLRRFTHDGTSASSTDSVAFSVFLCTFSISNVSLSFLIHLKSSTVLHCSVFLSFSNEFFLFQVILSNSSQIINYFSLFCFLSFSMNSFCFKLFCSILFSCFCLKRFYVLIIFNYVLIKTTLFVTVSFP